MVGSTLVASTSWTNTTSYLLASQLFVPSSVTLTIAAGTSLPVAVGSGVNPDNVGDILSVADAVIVASYLKQDGVWWNEVDPARVATFMQAVAKAR
jgi:predicted TIM-barrel enzyme